MDVEELHFIAQGREVRGLRLAGAPEVGPPIVLIHGIACSSAVFRALLACMATRTFRREAFALDMPGYGRTPGEAVLDIEGLAAWYDAALAALGVTRAHVVGHSMGCQVALALARRSPGRVASATLIGPTTGAEGERPGRYALGLLADSLFESWAYNRTLLKMWRQQGLRRYLATLPAMLRDRPVSRAREVRCRVLVVRGARDWIVPVRAVKRLIAALSDGSWTQVPGVAHAVQFDEPEAFIAALLPFLIDVEAAASVADHA